MTNDRIELVPGTLEMLVLKALVPGALHGYAVARRIRQMSDDVLTVEEGSLYPALHRMARRGLIEAEWGRSETNRRAKFYRLTPEGNARLGERVAQWEQVANAVGRVISAEWRTMS
jgi:PadR family transcriptional regulator PadR